MPTNTPSVTHYFCLSVFQTVTLSLNLSPTLSDSRFLTRLLALTHTHSLLNSLFCSFSHPIYHSMTIPYSRQLTQSFSHTCSLFVHQLAHSPTWHLPPTGCTSSVPQPARPSPNKTMPVIAPRQTEMEMTVIKETSHQGELFLLETRQPVTLMG